MMDGAPPDQLKRQGQTIRLRIDLAYDGAPFHGFARQRDATTVQGTLEGALFTLLRRHLNQIDWFVCDEPSDLATVGAGRTDAGVHALAQTLHVDVPASWPMVEELDRLTLALRKMVGPAITIWRVQVVPDRFDARFSATARYYRYRLCDAQAADPLWRFTTWLVGQPLDVGAMQAGATYLVGEHDWTSFCRKRMVTLASGEAVVAPMTRHLSRVEVQRVGDAGLVTIEVDGNAFCHQQVRAIAGCLVFVGKGKRPPEWVREVLAAQDRAVNASIAPPHGLTLIGVQY
ncbi:tRNA pseudouridine(38-40) synthase TruA [Stomatohabitans albus]|uniref:tRNA pseudouridine(38-40) synthase TruA n=1 Tax=Stomatohabitans albus TaxID=3110766 RepID=UPI00300C1E39